MTDAFITGFGKFLPGEPVGNDCIERYIGVINDEGIRIKEAALQQNGVQTRHYAINEAGEALHSNAEMAAHAARAALDDARRDASRLELLATATTQGDLLVPGFASAVHGALGIAPIEVASFQSVIRRMFGTEDA